MLEIELIVGISSRIDGVFLPQDTENPIYFTEVQFQKDSKIYLRLFSEIFTYLRDNEPDLKWRAMIIFKSRSMEPTERQRESVQPFLDSPLVKRIYLNELEVSETTPLGVQIIQLVVAKKKGFLERVTVLINRVKQQLTEENYRLQLLNLLSVIVLEKLPEMSRQELEAMFSIDDLKKTRFAQELMAETKIEVIPRLLKEGFSVEKIAEILELEIEQVRQAIANLN
ncbi:Rpn family recombination-promoting nuclease/putative transposase [Okeania sp. SIO2B3]|uniref:Rpn family recombination-promoting nuclease/putative transposase n=1 Tax=Okeania sp. SIO2B3 TaxID=2607784 RepID=UPI0013BF9D8E|nr:Rpn family recombination-promoting nuclease/putative transposase [Okeania sp. SIO2B3]